MSGSTRLPNKVLLKIKEVNFRYSYRKTKKLKKIDQLVIATTRKKEDKRIINIAKKNKVDFFCGDSEKCIKKILCLCKKISCRHYN